MRGLFSLLNFRKFRQMFLLILTLFRMLKIAGRVILKIRNSSATAILLMSRTMKIRKLKLFYCQKNARYRAKELWRDIFLGNLSLKEGKNSVGLPVLILEFWWRHVQTKNRKRNSTPFPATLQNKPNENKPFFHHWNLGGGGSHFFYFIWIVRELDFSRALWQRHGSFKI